jgi:hypothetical protein
MEGVIFKRGSSYYRGNWSDGKMIFSPYGGGFVRTMSEVSFKLNCEVVDGLPDIMIPSWVNIDYEMPVKAFVNPHKRWNGWSMPSFKLEDISDVVESYFVGTDYKIKRVDGGYFITDNHDEEYSFVSEDFEIDVYSEKVVVNSLVDGWCWEVATDLQAVSYYFLNIVKNATELNIQTGGSDKVMDDAFSRVFPVDVNASPEDKKAKSLLRKEAWPMVESVCGCNGIDYTEV